MISEFNKAHPHVRILLRTATRPAIEHLVLRLEVEIGVVTTASELPGLLVEPLRKEKLAAFVSVRHPLARKSKITLSDIAGTPFVIRGHSGNRSTSERILKEFKRLGFTTRVALTCDLPISVKEAVRKKLGIGLLYYDLIAPEISSGEFKMLKIPGLKLEGQSFIILPKDRPLSALARDFLAFLRRCREGEANHNGTRPKEAL